VGSTTTHAPPLCQSGARKRALSTRGPLRLLRTAPVTYGIAFLPKPCRGDAPCLRNRHRSSSCSQPPLVSGAAVNPGPRSSVGAWSSAKYMPFSFLFSGGLIVEEGLVCAPSTPVVQCALWCCSECSSWSPWRSTVVCYGWTGHKPGSGFFDIARPALGVFASLDRF
jgi:hypothetical protein